MALIAVDFATSNLAMLTSKLAALAPSSFAALIPAKLAALPVVAGVAIGTAAGASFVASSVPPAKPVQVAVATNAPVVMPVSATPAATARPCEEQTWPYIEPKCISGAAPQKRIRIVNAPRASDAVDPAASAGLTTSDTVLRQPQNIDAIPLARPEPAQREKRREARKRDRRYSAQPYQVPFENGRAQRPVIVVRPLRLDGR